MKYYATFLLLAVLFTTGCDKPKAEDPAPEVLPETTSVLHRSLYYRETSTRFDTTFQANTVRAYAAQDARELTIGIGPPTNTEGINFTFERSQLPSTLVGTYSLKTAGAFTTGTPTNAAFARYYYDLRPAMGTGTYLYLSSTTKVDGTFTITHYDAKRKLLSGEYIAVFSRVNDPNSRPSDTNAWFKCDITLTGSFENVLVGED
jgi:hypothetical protein